MWPKNGSYKQTRSHKIEQLFGISTNFNIASCVIWMIYCSIYESSKRTNIKNTNYEAVTTPMHMRHMYLEVYRIFRVFCLLTILNIFSENSKNEISFYRIWRIVIGSFFIQNFHLNQTVWKWQPFEINIWKWNSNPELWFFNISFTLS